MRFRGAITWKTVKGRDYLYRKRHGKWQALGRRSTETEQTYERFRSGRSAIRERIRSLDDRIRQVARINRAMGLGRVPWAAARILRKLEGAGLLGSGLGVVGTHALYAYERMAGGHLHSSQVATDDIDLLFDDRHKLGFVSGGDDADGLIGLLQAADPTFTMLSAGSYRAVDARGFMVDLIKPQPAGPATAQRPSAVGGNGNDLQAAEIEGLAWLQNSPQVQQTVIDEKGFPVRLDVPDPRAFSLHKYWLSKRSNRDPLKARRDRQQALVVAMLTQNHMPAYPFDPQELRAFPAKLRAGLPRLLGEAGDLDDAREDWL